MNQSISILTYSSLSPNRIQSRHGIFVAERLANLMHGYPVKSTVIAPVPWFPFRAPVFGEYARFAQVPRTEQYGEVAVHHPRFLVIPGLSWRVSPLLMYLATFRLVRHLHRTQKFDVLANGVPTKTRKASNGNRPGKECGHVWGNRSASALSRSVIAKYTVMPVFAAMRCWPQSKPRQRVVSGSNGCYWPPSR